MRQRHLHRRLRRVPLRGPPGHHPQPPRRRQPRHRGRLPGPRPGRQPRRRPEHVPRPRAAHRHPPRRGVDGAVRPGHPRPAVGPHAEVGAPAGLQPLRRPAADRGHRQGRPLGVQARHPRRADRGARCRPDATGPRPGAPAGRHRPRRRLHLAQHGRRLRGGRPGRRPVPRPGGRGRADLRGRPPPGHRAHHRGPVREPRHRRRERRRGRGLEPMSSAVQPSATDLPETPAPQTGFEGDAVDNSVGGYFTGYLNRVRGGDLGALPAIAGIVVLFILFTALRPNTFPTPLNLTNLLVQAVPISLLAMGLVFVLLLGEIDLSAGVVSGVCAAVMAVLMARQGVDWYWAVLAAMVVGTVIGLFTGVLVSVVRIPSFVVTLALFLGWQGVTLRIVGQGGTVPVRNQVIVGFTNDSMSALWGWILAVVVIVLYAAVQLNRWRVQRSRNLAHAPLAVVLGRIGVIAVVTLGVTALLNTNRALNPNITLLGVPYAIPIVVALLLVLTFVLTRTSFGRHVYAVGGNSEASRRAGINVTRIRILVFALSSTMAAVSGIAAASRLASVDASSGGGNTLLYAVAAAVIGGTSLFGGRGKVRDAVLGGLVIAIIDNGLGLLGVAAYLNFIITGLVLLLAASVDALARRRQAATGR